jgi:ankyrin repeat protein
MLLIERGADVTPARGGAGWKRAGWTALHYAAGLGFSTLVQPLLDRGADPSCRDEEGKTPLDVALDANHSEIATLLRSRGAK